MGNGSGGLGIGLMGGGGERYTGWKMGDGRWRMEDGRWEMGDGNGRTGEGSVSDMGYMEAMLQDFILNCT